MAVLWQLGSTVTCTVSWGLTTQYEIGATTNDEYNADHQHYFVIDNLTPGTKYYYSVDAGSYGVHPGSFTTAPADNATSVKFLAYGDTRSNPGNQDSVAAQMIATYTVDPAYQTILLHAGDWVSAGDTDSYWTTQWFDPTWSNLHELQANIPINGCKGNHEQTGTLFKKYFPYPYVSAFYWSFDYGPMHIAVVDQYNWTATERDWLTTDLAASSKQWKFIVLHEPGWSALGSHGNRLDVQTDIQPLCLADGVDIVFCGHNHYYARCVVDGVYHITTGGGGAPLNTPDQQAPYLVASASKLHYCEIDIEGTQLNFVARGTDGTTIDSFTVTHEIDPPTPDPAQFQAPPAAESAVQITMTAVQGQDVSLPVEYYFKNTTIADGTHDSGWITDTQYTDTALVANTQYTYTVQMRDAVGNVGQASSPASATTFSDESDPPIPNPATFSQSPTAISSTEISMTATVGTDATGPVEYYFKNKTIVDGTHDSGWITANQYTDTGLDPITQYTYTVTMRDALDNTGGPSADASTTTLESPPVDDYPNSDVPVAGTVGGSYQDTLAADGVAETITERLSGGKPSNRYNYLEHKWTFNVTGGQTVTFHVRAKENSGATEGFVFEYSTDDATYRPIVGVTVNSDSYVDYSSDLSSALISGMVYVRVLDTDQTRASDGGETNLDTISVDQLYFTSEGQSGGPCTPITVHVESIACGFAVTKGQKYGQVTVVICDNCGHSIEGATVTGDFTGSFTETCTALTDSNGSAILTTTAPAADKKPSYTFTVTDVSANLQYASNENVETSDTN